MRKMLRLCYFSCMLFFGGQNLQAGNISDFGDVVVVGDVIEEEPDIQVEGSKGLDLGKIRSWFDRFEEFMGRSGVIGPEGQCLPVGWRTTLGNTHYDLIVTDAVFASENTEVSVYMRILAPDWQGGNRCLYFGADKVLISRDGGFIGDVKLALAGNYSFSGKSDAFKVHLLGHDSKGLHESSADHLPPTYAIVNCNGFKELQISAVLELSAKDIAPVVKGKLQDKSLKVAFHTVAGNLDDILVEIEVPEFALRQVPDWRFSVEKAVFDFSIDRNAKSFGKIDGLPSSVREAGELWQGIYLEKLKIYFPYYIQTVSEVHPGIELSDMWIDENGFSGHFLVKDILSLDKGMISGWGFSVEELEMEFSRNVLEKGRMMGDIQLPVSKADAYSYEAAFQKDGEWHMQLALDGKVGFDFIGARKVELYKNSYLKGQRKDSIFLLEACLSGKMQMNPFASGEDAFGYGNFEFKDMKLRSQPPYLEVERIEWDDELRYGNFPVSVKDLTFYGEAEDLSLGFTTRVHLGGAENGDFSGELGWKIVSMLEKGTRRQQWVYKGVEFSDMKVDYTNSYLSFQGAVNMVRKHALYGDGFQGSLDVDIKPLNLGIRGDMMIGSRPTYRYWYVDIMARLGTAGIPVFPGFQISAIGGGAYQRMKLDAEDKYAGNLGKTASGLRYLPDSTVGLGVKSSLVLSTAQPDVFTSELGMEMAFNRHGGLSDIYLKGVAELMNKESKALERFNQKVLQLASQVQPSLESQRVAVASEASVSAQAVFQYDVANRIFTGSLKSYMDLGFIKGQGSRGFLGEVAMRMGRDDWFVKVGEPQAPLGIKMKVGPLESNLDAYFMTGKYLPPFPGIPSDLAYLFGQTHYQGPDLGQLRRGSGFAFGSRFGIETGELPLGLFYARFQAQLGFDIMMKQYFHTLCAETGTAPGFNSWFAQGQAYASMLADVGLQLKMFGKKMKFSVLKGEVGTMLQAALPNPSSFSGQLALNVSVLNGLVKGRFNVGFDLGESCTLIHQGFAEGKEVIADMRPGENVEMVDVFAIPQAAFNLPMEQEIVADYTSQEKRLKLDLDKYEVWYGGSRIEGELVWDEAYQSVSFVSHDILPPNATLDYKIEVSAKEKVGKSWKRLKTDEGEDYRESRHYTFKTGDGPDSIPWSNILHTYPVRGQKYFLPGEHRKGYVYLKRGMDYLLASPDYRKRLYLISATDTMDVAFTYNQAERRISWFMPEQVQPSTNYRLDFVLEDISYQDMLVSGATHGDWQASAARTGEGASSSTQRETTVIYSGDQGSLNQETVKLSSEKIKEGSSKVVLSYGFSTSRFRNFGQKLAASRITQTYRTPVLILGEDGNAHVESPDVHYLQAEMEAVEPFDSIELYGNRWSGGKALISSEAQLSGNSYFEDHIYPLVYKEYPYGGAVEFKRSESDQGLIPSWAVYISRFYDEEESGKSLFPWIYYLPVQYKSDFDQVLFGIAAKGIYNNPYYLTWMRKPFEKIKSGEYPIFLRYNLPHGQETSLRRVVFKNELD